MGAELLKSNGEASESVLKILWHQSDAIMCCSMKALLVFNFANQAGLDMLETTLFALQDITLENIFDDHGRKTLYDEFPQIMQQNRRRTWAWLLLTVGLVRGIRNGRWRW